MKKKTVLSSYLPDSSFNHDEHALRSVGPMEPVVKKMTRTVKILLCLAALVALAGCGIVPSPSAPDNGTDQPETSEEENMKSLHLHIDETEVPISWQDNRSVAALMQLAADQPLIISASRYGGFEQVGPLGQRIVSDDVQTATTPGDVVLYSGNQIVIFFGTNSWSYTRLGHVDLSEAQLKELLDKDNVLLTISRQ
jgi:hypothetical protein